MMAETEPKKSIDKPEKGVYKANKCREDILQPFTLEGIPPSIVTRKEIKDALRFLERAKRKLKKVLDRA